MDSNGTETKTPVSYHVEVEMLQSGQRKYRVSMDTPLGVVFKKSMLDQFFRLENAVANRVKEEPGERPETISAKQQKILKVLEDSSGWVTSTLLAMRAGIKKEDLVDTIRPLVSREMIAYRQGGVGKASEFKIVE